MSLGRELTQDDVGKFFRVRDPEGTNIIKVRVDSINTDRTSNDDIVTVTEFFDNGNKSSCSYCINGAFMEDSVILLNRDLVGPYIEPPKPVLNLGPEHVGKKVKLRDGSVLLITAYIPHGKFPIVTEVTYHLPSGHVYTQEGGKTESEHDIVEVLD